MRRLSKKKLLASGNLGIGLTLMTIDGEAIANSRLTINTAAQWVVSGNEATIVNANGNNRRLAVNGASDPVLKLNTTYNTQFEVVSVADGSVRLECGGTLGTNRAAPGIYNQQMTTGGTAGTDESAGVRANNAGMDAVVKDIIFTEV